MGLSLLETSLLQFCGLESLYVYVITLNTEEVLPMRTHFAQDGTRAGIILL